MLSIDLIKGIETPEQAAQFMTLVGGNVIFATGDAKGPGYVVAVSGLDRGREESNAWHATTFVEAVDKLRARLLVTNEASVARLERMKKTVEERLTLAKRGHLLLGDIDPL